MLKAVPHRHFVFSIPKILRRYFLPHCHVLCTDGGFYGQGMFRVAPWFISSELEKLFRHKEDLLAQLKDVDGWREPLHAMLRDLRKKGSLDEVKEALWGDYPESPYPVSDEEFLEELKSLDLADFLESVMLS